MKTSYETFEVGKIILQLQTGERFADGSEKSICTFKITNIVTWKIGSIVSHSILQVKN